MLHRTNVIILAALAILLALSYWGCERMDDQGQNANQAPTVYFVNLPAEGDTFNYAPIVRWYGADEDGLVEAFQYHDDSTAEAVAAYQAGDAALQAYIDALPTNSWVTTYNNADTIYLRRTEGTAITEHLFMIRAVDNLGKYSDVRVRTFFRTNNPPYAPTLKWALDVALETPLNYQYVYNVPDSLYWGDTLTSTYPGIGFLWQADDPDRRALNVIPLTYSYTLHNVSTGMAVPYFVYDDSNHVAGADTGWSPWTGAAEVTFTAANFFAFYDNLSANSLDGDYEFLLRVRDDGLTEADTVARATFKAVGAVMPNTDRADLPSNYERGLLVIDWTRSPSSVEIGTYGMRPDQGITDFYNTVIHNGLAAAEEYRTSNPLLEIAYPTAISPDFDWHLDKDLTNASTIVPMERLRHYKWVWAIMDNAPAIPPDRDHYILPRIKVLQEYMKVGGQVLLSGRGVFRTLGIQGIRDLDASLGPDRFVRDYFNIRTVCGKTRYQANGNNITDFGSVTTTDSALSDLVLDDSLAYNLSFGNGIHFHCLPEIEYFGRSGASNGTDYSTTLYNYGSCSVNDSFSVHNVLCPVSRSTPTTAWLKPALGHTRILDVTRVFNRTLGVAGEFMRVDREMLANGTLGDWRIVVSTPSINGAWRTTDSVDVDYTYVPIQPSNDQPVATDYIRFESVFTYDRFTDSYSIGSFHRFRSGLMTFPLSFMRNDPIPGRSYGTADRVVMNQALFFNMLRVSTYRYSTGNGGN